MCKGRLPVSGVQHELGCSNKKGNSSDQESDLGTV